MSGNLNADKRQLIEDLHRQGRINFLRRRVWKAFSMTPKEIQKTSKQMMVKNFITRHFKIWWN